MQSIEWFVQYAWFRQALVTGLAVGSICSLLSVIVVLKRMAFVGQGISHAAFGGVGTAIFLGLAGVAQDAMVFAFCLVTALAIGVLSKKRKIEVDSAIGILLVGAMAWGVALNQLSINLQNTAWYVDLFGPRGYRAGFEALLFGSILSVDAGRMWTSLAVSVAVLVVGVAFFKEILFFTFDERVSRAFGVRADLIHYLLLGLLALTIVMGMMLVGVVLISALLVIPGATALQLSRKLGRVMLLSWLVGAGCTVGGLMLSIELGDMPTGPCIVGLLCAAFGLAYSTRALRR